MRIQLASDLHLEFLTRQRPFERLIGPAPGADLLVLAGDIAEGTRGIELFADWPVPVLYVAGNHEFYGRSWSTTRAELRAAASGTSVIVLDNERADFSRFGNWHDLHCEELSRIRFLGATLWTDYRLAAGFFTQREAMQAAEMAISDHFRIDTQEGKFRAAHALEDHERSRNWLERALRQPFEGATVVVTHHGPHPLSIHPRWLQPATRALNAAFSSDLAELVGLADVWLHGHVHDSMSYEVDGCRVVTNPRGYPLNPGRGATNVGELEPENPAFIADLIVEV